MKHTVFRLTYITLLLAGWLLLGAGGVLAGTPQQGARTVYLLEFDGAVTPVLARYLDNGIDAAVAADAEALILQLDTPGGSTDVTKTITQIMLASPVPVVVYVAPAGAQAGSAGTFLTLAAHVAAMAPGTSIGAASPVSGDGQTLDETMRAKVENILSADIENLAARRGDAAVEWAVAAVQEAAAATADRALELGVIDYVAADLPALLEQMDGATVTVQGVERTLRTAGATVAQEEMGWLSRFLNFITNPTIAALLLSLGAAGLLAEVWNPGTWVPGVIGVISLLLGLYALGQLDANFAALALMAVGVILFVAEAFTPAFGALLVAGMVAFGLGGLLLFDTPGVELPWPAIIALAVALGLLIFWMASKGLAAQRRPVRTGSEGLMGRTVRLRQPLSAGQPASIFLAGEWWTAELDDGTVDAGETVEVTGQRGLTLLVQRAQDNQPIN
jgi:membrane-bound serine protease (ClpP class)